MARPTKFKEEYKNQVRKMAEFGLIDSQMSIVLGVTEQTFNNWKKSHPQFFESLKAGRDISDDNVEKSLYKKCMGYSHKDTKFATYEGKITDSKEYIKHYPPSDMAMIYWLNNRRPEKWRQRIDHTTGGGKIVATPIIVDSQETADKLANAVKDITK